MSEELRKQMSVLMYALTKEAARSNFIEFLDGWGLSMKDYEEIRDELIDKFGIDKPYI